MKNRPTGAAATADLAHTEQIRVPSVKSAAAVLKLFSIYPQHHPISPSSTVPQT